MQLLAILRRRTESFSTEDFEAKLDAEAEAVRRLYADGFIRNAWSRDDTPGGCLLIEAASPEDARMQLQALPLVAKEMADMQIIPLRGYRGFGPRT